MEKTNARRDERVAVDGLYGPERARGVALRAWPEFVLFFNFIHGDETMKKGNRFFFLWLGSSGCDMRGRSFWLCVAGRGAVGCEGTAGCGCRARRVRGGPGVWHRPPLLSGARTRPCDSSV